MQSLDQLFIYAVPKKQIEYRFCTGSDVWDAALGCCCSNAKENEAKASVAGTPISDSKAGEKKPDFFIRS
jgi:hypothetical protein